MLYEQGMWMALRQILLPGVDGPGVLTTSIQREGARRHRQFKSFFKEEGSKLPVVRSQLVNPYCESHPHVTEIEKMLPNPYWVHSAAENEGQDPKEKG